MQHSFYVFRANLNGLPEYHLTVILVPAFFILHFLTFEESTIFAWQRRQEIRRIESMIFTNLHRSTLKETETAQVISRFQVLHAAIRCLIEHLYGENFHVIKAPILQLLVYVISNTSVSAAFNISYDMKILSV